MGMLVVVAIGLIGVILAGLLLFELVVTVGFRIFNRAVGSRFLPVVLGIIGAVAAPVLDERTRRTCK